jgi:Transposase, Mutator family
MLSYLETDKSENVRLYQRFGFTIIEEAAIREVLPQAAWQRCYVHFLRNALDYVPRKVDDDCLPELRWLYARRDLAEARNDLTAWLARGPASIHGSPPGLKRILKTR